MKGQKYDLERQKYDLRKQKCNLKRQKYDLEGQKGLFNKLCQKGGNHLCYWVYSIKRS
jgi:hypothetical protein